MRPHYRMSLLAQVNQPNKDAYYFALDTSPATPVVTAPAFEAIGGAAPAAPTGSFTALADAPPGGIGVFNIGSLATKEQNWAIGLDAVPAGANSGNNLTIFAYDDAGAFLGAPLSIERDNGTVTMPENVGIGGSLTVGATLFAGTPTTVGGGEIQVDGTAGESRVFDAVYNRPVPGPEFVMTTTDNLLTQTVVQNISVTKSGLYVFTMEVKASATGLAFTNGTSIINAYLFTSGPSGYITDSYLCCDFVANPTGYNTPGPTIPPNTYVKDVVAIVNLQAGVTYSAGVFGSAGINLGQSGAALGGVRCFIQQLIA